MIVSEYAVEGVAKEIIEMLPKRPQQEGKFGIKITLQQFTAASRRFWEEVDRLNKEEKFQYAKTFHIWNKPGDIGKWLYDQNLDLFWTFYNLACVSRKKLAIYDQVYYGIYPQTLPVYDAGEVQEPKRYKKRKRVKK